VTFSLLECDIVHTVKCDTLSCRGSLGTRSAKGDILCIECRILSVVECDIIAGAMSHFARMKCHIPVTIL
jgi:hypothetical protein